MKTPTMQSNQWGQEDVTHDVRQLGGGVRREDGEKRKHLTKWKI